GRFSVVEGQRAFHHTVDRPDSNTQKDNQTNDQHERDNTNHRPKQRDPEGSNLLAEVSFYLCASYILKLYIIDDDAHKSGNTTEEERQPLQDINDNRQVPGRLGARGSVRH